MAPGVDARVGKVNNAPLRMRELWEAQRGLCFWCRKDVQHPDRRERTALGTLTPAALRDTAQPSLDHLVPVSRGGSNLPRNLVLAHRHCNQNRKDRIYKAAHPEELARAVHTPKKPVGTPKATPPKPKAKPGNFPRNDAVVTDPERHGGPKRATRPLLSPAMAERLRGA